MWSLLVPEKKKKDHLFWMHYSVHKEDDPTVEEEPTIMAEVQIWLCRVSLGALAAPGLFCEPCEKGQHVQLPVSVSTVLASPGCQH